MAGIKYNQLNVLIADDFSNFRSTVAAMLSKMGVSDVVHATDGQAVVENCTKKSFDLILCDYDLGSGKTGQQALEELQFRSLLPLKTIFIIVSADSAKDVVMASYDCEPDDYLTKPITAQVLQKRILRLLMRREALSPVHRAIESHDYAKAMSILVDLSISGSRFAGYAQKLLGEMFIAQGELVKAENLYTKALQTRQVDWARLGLAQVKQLSGELETAGAWLERIVEENPLYLPAYDSLVANWEGLGQAQQVQRTVQRSVDISPKSILRQKKLADVAERNGDLATALAALRYTVRLGEQSCHASPNDNFNFARVASSSIDRKLSPLEPLNGEVRRVLGRAKERFSLTREQEKRAQLLEGRLLALEGNEESARALVRSVELALGAQDRDSLEAGMDRVVALRSLGDAREADTLLSELLSIYAYDQDSLQRLDALSSEPVSEASRQMVASVNREGIELYNQERYDDAVACFNQVGQIFPRHVGVHLNIAQALIGKIQSYPDDEQSKSLAKSTLDAISVLVDLDHKQFQRFDRLRKMASSLGISNR